MSFDTFRAELQRRGLSVNKVALMAEITPSALYAALSGNVRFYPGWKKRVAEVLQMDERELFEEVTGDEANQND